MDITTFSNIDPTREQAIEAIAHLSLMKLDTDSDYLLYLASLNLLNRYVKINKKVVSYRFKSFLFPLLYTAIETNKTSIKIFPTTDKDMNSTLLMMEVKGVQFSFHSVRFTEVNQFAEEHNFLYQPFEWSEIRLQPIAANLYEESKKNDDLSINDYKGNKISESLSKSVEFITEQSSDKLYLPWIVLTKIRIEKSKQRKSIDERELLLKNLMKIKRLFFSVKGTEKEQREVVLNREKLIQEVRKEFLRLKNKYPDLPPLDEMGLMKKLNANRVMKLHRLLKQSIK